MKLKAHGKPTDQWVVSYKDMNGKEQDVEVETRAQVFAFVRAYRLLGGDDNGVIINRSYMASFKAEGD